MELCRIFSPVEKGKMGTACRAPTINQLRSQVSHMHI
jgi:hypothetical protein